MIATALVKAYLSGGVLGRYGNVFDELFVFYNC